MVSDATVAKERESLVLRREVWRADAEQATFMSGLSRGIEGADTVPPQCCSRGLDKRNRTYYGITALANRTAPEEP
jgi:hypothetical protein